MVRIEDHIQEMQKIFDKAQKTQGKAKKQLMKCYHRMCKQLNLCNIHLKGSENHGRRQTEI